MTTGRATDAGPGSEPDEPDLFGGGSGDARWDAAGSPGDGRPDPSLEHRDDGHSAAVSTSAPHRAPNLQPDTPMQKVVLPGLVDLLVGNVTVPGRFDPHRIAGFVTRLEDVPTGAASDLARRYGLDQVSGWPMSSELHVLRFFAHHPVPYISPFGRHVYQMDLLEVPAGTELWRIDSSGTEQRIAAYLHRQMGWVATVPLLLGPGRWNTPPVPLRPTVRRGLAARYRGGDFDADFGPRPGEVTLHPLPGRQAPGDFTSQGGVQTLPVSVFELDSLLLLRWRAFWRDLPVELVETSADEAVVHYVGEDDQRATDLGLAEVDYRVWRGPVPRAELSEVRQESTTLRAARP